MYGLLPSGKELHAESLEQVADESVRRRIHPVYEERFLPLNDDFKQLCTDWQVRAGEPNDHTDEAYDRSCRDRLGTLYATASSVIDELVAADSRFARYGDRLGRAADCVAAGESKRFTGVMCESFHDIWMELHEDLIVIQHVDRAEEGSF